MKKLYFENESSDLCFPKKYFQELMEENGLSQIEVFEAEPFKIDYFFWCKEFQELGEISSSFLFDRCGRECKSYSPRNGKSGCCKHYSKIMYEPGEKVILKQKQ